MPSLSGETIGVIVFLVAGPALVVWGGRSGVKMKHAVVCAVLSALLAATGGAAVASIQPGWGMFGVMLWLGGLGALALALVLFSAAIAIVVALRTRGDRDDDESISKYQHVPLTEMHRHWQRQSGRPQGNYGEFLRDAHRRYFPPSIASLVLGGIALVVVFVLILRR